MLSMFTPVPGSANTVNSLSKLHNDKVLIAAQPTMDDFNKLQSAALANLPKGTRSGQGIAIVAPYGMVSTFNPSSAYGGNVLLQKQGNTWQVRAIKVDFTVSDLESYGLSHAKAKYLLYLMNQPD